MKQIQFFQGISKKVTVSGPAIKKNQTYKCVVFSSFTDATTTIYVTAVADEITIQHPDKQIKIGSVVFDFSQAQTATLKLGDNNLAVYDVNPDEVETQSDKTLYRVYEAKVYAQDSIANHLEN